MTTVLLANEAAEELSSLPERVYKRVSQVIDRLAVDPVSGSYFLRSTKHGTDLHVIRAGDYRMIYSINHERNVVAVINIARNR